MTARRFSAASKAGRQCVRRECDARFVDRLFTLAQAYELLSRLEPGHAGCMEAGEFGSPMPNGRDERHR